MFRRPNRPAVRRFTRPWCAERTLRLSTRSALLLPARGVVGFAHVSHSSGRYPVEASDARRVGRLGRRCRGRAGQRRTRGGGDAELPARDRRVVAQRGGQVAGSETKLAVGARRGRKPDLSVYLLGRLPGLDDALVRVTPHLVIEVASPRPRDARRDRVDKLRDYARAGIRYYWIMDPRLRSLEIFELTDRGPYALAVTANEGRVRVPGCAGLVVDLDALWKEVDDTARPPARSSRKRR
jgi:hypothetical protein